jgi:hypothetical protein
MNYLHIQRNNEHTNLLSITSSTKLFEGWIEPFIAHGLIITFHFENRNQEFLSSTLYTSELRNKRFYFNTCVAYEYTYGAVDLSALNVKNYSIRTRFHNDKEIGREFAYEMLFSNITKFAFYEDIGTDNPDGMFDDMESKEAREYLSSVGLAYTTD